MVLLALLIPLLEWQRWSGERFVLADELRRRLPAFMDERTDCVARWLPVAEDMLQGDEPHEHPRLMDSWYLFHPLLNMGRLAAWGDEEARACLLSSLGLAIKVAHRFDYDWPVFYDIDTLKVIKAETKPGEGGEHDVPGLYAHVMLQAWDLTGDQRYLDEAVAAGRSMIGKGFELAYQINNVAFGLESMLRLHQITGDAEFRGVAHVLAACMFDNSGLWQCLYGDAAERSTFIGVYPLTDAPYTAAYEEAEAAAASLAYVTLAGDDLYPPLKLLMPEVVRHTTARLDDLLPLQHPATCARRRAQDRPHRHLTSYPRRRPRGRMGPGRNCRPGDLRRRYGVLDARAFIRQGSRTRGARVLRLPLRGGRDRRIAGASQRDRRSTPSLPAPRVDDRPAAQAGRPRRVGK